MSFSKTQFRRPSQRLNPDDTAVDANKTAKPFQTPIFTGAPNLQGFTTNVIV